MSGNKSIELPVCLVLVKRRRPPFGPTWPRHDVLLIDSDGRPMQQVHSFAITGIASDPTAIVRVWRVDPSKPKAHGRRKPHLLQDIYALLDIRSVSAKKFYEYQLDLSHLGT